MEYMGEAIPADFQEFIRYVGGVIPADWNYPPDTKVEIGQAKTEKGAKSVEVRIENTFPLADTVEKVSLDKDLNLTITEEGETEIYADWATFLIPERLNKLLNDVLFSSETAQAIGVANTYEFKLKTLYYIGMILETQELRAIVFFIAFLIGAFKHR